MAKKLPTQFPTLIAKPFDSFDKGSTSLQDLARAIEDMRKVLIEVMNDHADEIDALPTLGSAAEEDVGTDIGDVVQLEDVGGGTAGLPVIDGSQLTGIDAFPSGTKMLFQQTSAPTGWTKLTSGVANRALRLTNGTVTSGGASGFTSVFGSGKTTASHALTVSEMPPHGHTVQAGPGTTGGQNGIGNSGAKTGGITYSITSLNAGSGSGHSHNLSLDILYLDVILAQKD